MIKICSIYAVTADGFSFMSLSLVFLLSMVAWTFKSVFFIDTFINLSSTFPVVVFAATFYRYRWIYINIDVFTCVMLFFYFAFILLLKKNKKIHSIYTIAVDAALVIGWILAGFINPMVIL